jgi:hypothetical protein
MTARLTRIAPYAVSVVSLLAVAAPILTSTRTDSFPLSNYPMFSGRATPETSIPHAIAIDADGGRSVLPPSAVFNDEIVQAWETLRQAIAAGPEATIDLCDQIATRAPEDAVTVEIVTDRFDAIRYFEGDKTPLQSTVHATCEVLPQ